MDEMQEEISGSRCSPIVRREEITTPKTLKAVCLLNSLCGVLRSIVTDSSSRLAVAASLHESAGNNSCEKNSLLS